MRISQSSSNSSLLTFVVTLGRVDLKPVNDGELKKFPSKFEVGIEAVENSGMLGLEVGAGAGESCSTNVLSVSVVDGWMLAEKVLEESPVPRSLDSGTLVLSLSNWVRSLDLELALCLGDFCGGFSCCSSWDGVEILRFGRLTLGGAEFMELLRTREGRFDEEVMSEWGDVTMESEVTVATMDVTYASLCIVVIPFT